MNGPRNRARGDRPIDRIREAAGSATIPPGHGNIVSMKTIDHRIYFLAERGLTSGVMADSIDPERTNLDIPFIVQRVEIAYGVEHPFMQKTVCVAFELIDPTYLPSHVDNEQCLTLAVGIATSLASVMDVVGELHMHQSETREKGKAGQLTQGYVPRTTNLKGKVHQCIAALRDIEIAIKKTTIQFYPKDAPNDSWDKKFKADILAEYGKQDGFGDYIYFLWLCMDNVGDHRNAMIHPDDTKSILIYDYELDATGAFVAPTIEIKHPLSPVARHDISQFLEVQAANISNVYESLLGYMCDLNVRPLNKMLESRVTTLPHEERRNGSQLVWRTNVREGFSFPDNAITENPHQ